MKVQFLDGIGNANLFENINSAVNAGANVMSSVANIVSAKKGTGVVNMQANGGAVPQSSVSSMANDSTALLQQQLLLQQMANGNKPPESKGLSTNAMIGIAVGGVAILGVIIAVIATKK